MRTHFGPFGVEFDRSGGVLKGPGELSQLDQGGGSVGEEDMVARIKSNGLSVQGDGRLEIPILTGLIRLAHFVQESGFAGGR